MGIWDLLGISPTKDIKLIKKAYAEKVRLYHPEEEPEMFSKIHIAYTEAVKYAKNDDELPFCFNSEARELIHNDIYKSEYSDVFNSAKEHKKADSDQENNIENKHYNSTIDDSIKNYMIKKRLIDNIIGELNLKLEKSKDSNGKAELGFLLKCKGFAEYKDDPYMLSKLEKFITQNDLINPQILLAVFHAYDFYKTENQKNNVIYSSLYIALSSKIIANTINTQVIHKKSKQASKMSTAIKAARRTFFNKY